MQIILSTAARNARATALKNLIDAGSGNGKVKFYTASNVLIATCELSKPCATISGGVMTFATVSDDLAADTTGVIDYGITCDSDDNAIIQCDAGESSSGAFYILNTVNAVAGGTVQVLSLSFTEGNA